MSTQTVGEHEDTFVVGSKKKKKKKKKEIEKKEKAIKKTKNAVRLWPIEFTAMK